MDTKLLVMSIALAFSFLQFILPYFDIYPPYYPKEKSTFDVKFYPDYRDEDGWYSTKIIDLNYTPFELKNSFKLEGLVPNPGRIKIFIENYTVSGDVPKFFKITEQGSRSEKDWFNVNGGAFEKVVSLNMFPGVTMTDSNYLMALTNDEVCSSGTIKVFYRIEYYDIDQDITTSFFIYETFAGKWEKRNLNSCFNQ